MDVLLFRLFTSGPVRLTFFATRLVQRRFASPAKHLGLNGRIKVRRERKSILAVRPLPVVVGRGFVEGKV